MRIISLAGLLLTVFPLQCLSQSIPDSVLRQMLTRAVYSWQEGRAKDAFFTLDSVIAQPISVENAGSKVKAALWTSSYLMEQRKIRPAKAFIDSALSWTQRFPLGEENVRVYQALSQWHVTAGDATNALRFKDKAWEHRDSLSKASYTTIIDSLKEVIARSESKSMIREQEETEATPGPDAEISSNFTGSLWLMIPVIVLVAVVAFYLSRSRKTNSPLKSASSSVTGTPTVPANNAERKVSNPIPVFEFQPSPDPTKAMEEDSGAPEAPPLSNRETLARLQGVELVLIRPEVLAAYQNGDLKSIRNLLNEYMAQLPFIMKTLDEAINRNETAPILLSLQHVKSYLKLFGMQATEKLIGEVESESATEKVSKLLSRVFQVRNHCRRAADEAKSLLEKIG